MGIKVFVFSCPIAQFCPQSQIYRENESDISPPSTGRYFCCLFILDASKKLYDNVQRDINLPKTFQVVGYRLPVIRHTLETCEAKLKLNINSVPENVCEELDNLIYACQRKAKNLEGIFEKVIPGPSDTLHKRYSTALRRLGKGTEVEQLMKAITEDVQFVVSHHAVMSADQRQNTDLDEVIREIESLPSSAQIVNSGAGTQINCNNNGSGKQQIHTGSGNMYIAETQHIVSVKQDDFSFREPVGLLLRKTPEMAEYFKNNPHQPCLVLGGMGGIGKTQLAITYAMSNSDSYGSVFWLNAANEAILNSSFKEIASNIFKLQNLEKVSNSNEMIQRVHNWLSDTKNTSWLMIFDNYDDDFDGQFELNDYYPLASHGTVIVTTRRPDLVTRSNHTLEIKPLQRIQDSLAILPNRSKRSTVQSDPFAKRLAERLGGLPLALATAGTYLHRSTFSFEKYLQEYEKRWDINPKVSTKLQDYCERTLYTTWDLSFAHLKIEDNEAAEMLKLLAYFHNQRIWYQLFQGGLRESSPEWIRGLVADDVSFERVMISLTDNYFLEVDLESKSWIVHSCVHDWTLAVLNKKIDLQYYWPNEAEKMYQRARAGYEKALGPDHILTLDTLKNLGGFYLDQGRLDEAEPIWRRARIGYEEVLGPSHLSTLDAIGNLGLLYDDQANNLGGLYLAQGKLNEAEELYRYALAGRESVLGPNNILTLNTVNNLGNLYRAKRELEACEQMYTRALTGYEIALTLNKNHKSILRTVHNLGALYCDQGKFDKAEEMYKRAVAGHEEELGLEHSLTLDAIKRLGNLYFGQRKWKKAEPLYLQAQAGYEKNLGPDDITTLNIIKNLGSVYIGQQRLVDAELMYARVMVGYQKVWGENHATTLQIVNYLGVLCEAQNKLDDAEKMYALELAGYEREQPPNQTLILGIAKTLGDLYHRQGKMDEAERMYARVKEG
ncbi:hypothetical protein N7507_010040 [Penicillium longicatenatum]|nr:hypothetical protein N7507_010040 [Penicillium longicatenatum]